MRRRLLKLALFLLLGAIINVAVAWGFAIKAPVGEVDISHVECWSMLADLAPVNRFEGDMVYGYRGQAWGYHVTDVHSITSSFWGSQHVCTAGWPMPSLCGTLLVVIEQDETTRWNCDWAIQTQQILPSRNESEYVPLQPIWPGFAINTVFYALILWGLFAAPFALRRRRRIQRGLCPMCAYDLRNRPIDSAACPECGANAAPSPRPSPSPIR